MHAPTGNSIVMYSKCIHFKYLLPKFWFLVFYTEGHHVHIHVVGASALLFQRTLQLCASALADCAPLNKRQRC